MTLSRIAAGAAMILISLTLSAQIAFDPREIPVGIPRPSMSTNFGGDVASNEDVFVVTFSRNLHAYGVRVDRTGAVIDAVPREIPATRLTGIEHQFIGLAYLNGTWHSYLLDASLAVIGDYDLGTLTTPMYNVSFVANRSGALVVLSTTNEFFARRLDPTGAPQSDWLSLGPRNGANQLLAGADPNGFEVVALYPETGTPMHILKRRITSNGELSDWVEVPARLRSSIGGLAFAGTHYGVVTGPTREVLFFSIEGNEATTPFSLPQGASLFGLRTVVGRPHGITVVFDFASYDIEDAADHPTSFHGAALPGYPDVTAASAAAIGDAVLVSWARYLGFLDDYFYDIYAGLNGGGTPAVVSRSAFEQRRPKIAAGDGVSLIVWQEADTATKTSRVFARRVVADGIPIGDAIAISDPAKQGHSPAVAFGQGAFLVVWIEDGQVVGRRVTTNGFAQPMFIVFLYNSSEAPSVAYGDGIFLVAYVGRPASRSFEDIYATRVSLFGPLDVINVSHTELRDSNPQVTFGAGRFAVGWNRIDWFGGHTPLTSIAVLAFMTPDGSVAAPIALSSTATNAVATGARVAWNGTEFLAGWSGDGATWVQRFDRNGNPGSAAVIVAPMVPQLDDVGAADGKWLLLFNGMTEAAVTVLNGNLAMIGRLLLGRGSSTPVTDGGMIVYRRVVGEAPYLGAGGIFLRQTLDSATPVRRRTVSR
jgi:hypothetical protein